MAQQERNEDEPNLMLKLYELNEIGIALSKEKDHNKLLEKILMGAITLTHADGGTLYLLDEKNELQFEVLHTSSMNFHYCREHGGANPFGTIPLYTNGKPNDRLVVCHAALNDQTVNIEDVYTETVFDCSGTKEFDDKSGYHCQALLAVPMKDHEGTMIGVLQLINPTDFNDRSIIPFSKRDEHVVRSLASQAAVMLSQLKLIKDLQNTFQGFVEAIGEAIDKKSKHTGMHCQRVPIITKMLGEAVNRSNYNGYADFHLSEEELYELHMAALLHDCGKIATPIHIIDKATKLETVFDREELIATRIQALKTQVQLQAIQSGSDCTDAIKELDKDLAFIKRCNKGSVEELDTDRKRLKKIQSKTWLDADGNKKPLLTDDELQNLCIARGTLNEQERKIMNDHVVNTIAMLKHLPLPKKLSRVPEIAGAHHEHINGKGYPFGIKGDKMSPQAKILAIADVFEALTAPDRPYKKPTPLSKALIILRSMMKEGHLDKELGEVFIREKVYLDYAKNYLTKEQIDTEK